MSDPEHLEPTAPTGGWLESVRALLEPPELLADEAEAYVKESSRRVIQRFRLGVPIGIAVIFAIFLLWLSRDGDATTRNVVVAACLVAACTLAAYLPLSGLRVFRERPNRLILPVSLVVVGAGAAVATASGGGGSIDILAAAGLLVVWIYGSVLAPLPPRDFFVDIVAQHAVVSSGLWLGGHAGQIPWMYVAITLGGAGLALLGVILRENADRRSFVAHRRLDDAHRLVAKQSAELEQMNAGLEQRVEAQVKEIVQHAREVDTLNAQLQQHVRERSRELATALERLGEAEEGRLARQLEPGNVVGERARVVRLLGTGGMGEVYLCEDLLTGKRVALKVFRGGGEIDDKAMRRMLAEASAASSVAHPGLVKTLHVDVTADGNLYLLTEYVSGETLSKRLDRGALGVAETARLGEILAGALAAAHSKGVVHRDVKPHNVMLTSTAPGVKLLDFGISKTGEKMFQSHLTETGQVLGTPAYMAPEQFKNPSGVTSACDVYSLGLLVYEAAAGRGPFEIENPLQAIAAHTLEDPPPLADIAPAVPKEMSELVASCLAKDPLQRPTAAHVASALGRIGDRLGAPEATEFAPPASVVAPTMPGARDS